MAFVRIGFIGLGNMGLPMAKNLVKKGFPVTVCGHMRKKPVEEMRSMGATVVASPREVAAASDVVLSCVRDIPQNDEVIFGKDGVWEGIREGATVIISSTVKPSYMQEVYAKAKERGVQVIDAPVSGTSLASEAGSLTFMVGGDEDVVNRCRPILEAMGKNIFHLGGIGMGQAFKLVNNLVGIGNWVSTQEAVNLGLKAGLDLKTMIDVMKVSTGGNWFVQNWDFWMEMRKLELSGQWDLKGLADKDRDFAIEMGEEVGANMPLARFIAQLDVESTYLEFSAL